MTDNVDFDLIVSGATPGGITCALRAEREGLRVLLTHYYSHIGGMLSNGLGSLDTQYAGKRAPIHAEFCERLLGFYRECYGCESEQYRSCFAKVFSRYDTDSKETDNSEAQAETSAPGPLPERYYGRMNFEAHVAEAVFEQMLSETRNLTVWRDCVPDAVEKDGGLLRSVTFLFSDGTTKRTTAHTFADCTYEGDLLALAGAPYRVGRESRTEFCEPHAGRIFTALHFATPEEIGYPREAVEGHLNLEPYEAISQQVYAGSTGEGDAKVQAYTFRLTLSDDPDNRIMPDKPENYEREIYLRMRNRWSLGASISNRKLRWNTSNLPGGSWAYPESDWTGRKEILKQHRDHALGFLWFLQHDDAVPAQLQERARCYGLAKDEFTDNGGVPWEMYVREARRLIGRYVFSEHDATLGSGLERAPIHRDSIAITEWGMDSHSVSEEMTPGSRREGKFLLTELTRPGQIPWRCLLPPDLDNLMVPVCLSATHVGWGTVRLEPTWMHIGESAGVAAALASQLGQPVAQLKVSLLQRCLVESGVMISFFNEFDMSTLACWEAAVQFMGSKWFFSSYNARPEEALDSRTAEIWAGITADILAGKHRHLEDARWSEIYPKPGASNAISGEGFYKHLVHALKAHGHSTDRLEALWSEEDLPADKWMRGQACYLIYRLLDKRNPTEILRVATRSNL